MLARTHQPFSDDTKYNEKPLNNPSISPGPDTLVHMDATPWILAAVAGAGAIGVARLATAVTRRRRRRQALEIPASVDDPTRGRPRPWVILNPSKHADPQAFKERINRKAKELGIEHVHWRETTPEDPGTGQAVRALEEGASVVIAAGGDGTVRAVAAGMAGSGVRMGIIPVGTGNVLAGNLSIPDDPNTRSPSPSTATIAPSTWHGCASTMSRRIPLSPPRAVYVSARAPPWTPKSLVRTRRLRPRQFTAQMSTRASSSRAWATTARRWPTRIPS